MPPTIDDIACPRPPGLLQKLRAFLLENRSAKQTVAKNAVWLSISQLGGRVIRSAIIIYAARVLGASEYGVFSYAITLAGFVSAFMDLGVNALLMRDITRAYECERQRLFSASLAIKLTLVAIGAASIGFAGPHISLLPRAETLLPMAI